MIPPIWQYLHPPPILSALQVVETIFPQTLCLDFQGNFEPLNLTIGVNPFEINSFFASLLVIGARPAQTLHPFPPLLR